MSIAPTIELSTACARPRVSWSIPAVPSTMPSASLAYRFWMMDTELSVVDLSVCGFVGINHAATNGHDGTTGSKRLNPGHLDEVST